MDEHFNYNKITVTTIGSSNLVECDLLRTEGDQQESVALSVLIPLGGSESLRETQKRAVQRAIELLQQML